VFTIYLIGLTMFGALVIIAIGDRKEKFNFFEIIFVTVLWPLAVIYLIYSVIRGVK
jgi:hypothetical protein